MTDVSTWLSVVACGALALLALDLATGWGRVPDFSDVPDEDRLPGGAPWPRLSIVVAARDEERMVETALRSLLALDYPDLEIVVVDDRSTDRTGAVLDALAAKDERLRVLHVRELPPGWLGKNHALHVGAAQVTGELILFTDADVVFAPRALRKGVRLLRDRGADHLAAALDIHVPGLIETAFVAAFAVFFTTFTRPWKVPDPRSRAHFGVGAFNMVRADAYRAIGGHERLRLRPDDDLKLGKVLKTSGFRSLAATAPTEASVEWYRSFREAARGLEKNMFAGVEYSVPTVIVTSAVTLVLWLWPFAGLFVADGVARWICVAAIALQMFVFVVSTRRTRFRPWTFVLFPLGVVLFVYCYLRSTVLALVRGGIDWRGTRYPLRELRANRV